MVTDWKIFNPPAELAEILAANGNVTLAGSTAELVDLACGGTTSNEFEVSYQLTGYGRVVEAVVVRARNGVCVNYTAPYMRRRDPDAMLIGDDLPTDQPTFQQVFDKPFADLRQRTFEWLKTEPLAMYAYRTGSGGLGHDALVVAPANAGFFAFGLALLQGILSLEEIPADFAPASVIYVAPTFRYTDLDGKQVVVHNRREHLHEVFSYNLYPGPSAKKAVYGILLHQGEQEGWVTNHCSAVRVVTPYENSITIMHEGASGAGKSEMLEHAHREDDGRLLYGENVITGEQRHVELPRTCDLFPVADDMAMCHPSLQNNGKITILDAENAWFVRTNHITRYGTDLLLERLTANPPEPLLFLNINAAPGGFAMIWDHVLDAPGKPCPNPRVTIPRAIIRNVVDEPVEIDFRSFGIRTPLCTSENPSYGIIGFLHLLPPALAWLWRLASPRGYDNPSILETKGLASEGVGSYWPFATGKRTRQANLLLEQFLNAPRTRYTLIPNQNVGAWHVGFMPQWLVREVLARRGTAKYDPANLREARCSLLGMIPHQMVVEGRQISRWFFQVETQPEVGIEAYDQGAEILYHFFQTVLADFLADDLDPLGRQIIECAMDHGSVYDYENLIPGIY
ncbi:MAG TPA: DUF4914 family protein [Chloroflexi bacterium]|nr:DUF4914 family protein [Chloroflexota bacterium]